MKKLHHEESDECYFKLNRPNSCGNDYLPIYYQNVRSIRSRVNEVFFCLNVSDYDVICLTESWLDSSISNCEFMPSSYCVFRADRNFTCSNRQRGGGVVLAVSDKFPVSSVDLSVFDAFHLIDIVACKLCCGRSSLFIFVIYIPPDVSIQEYELFLECFENIAVELDNILIIGDFNAPTFSNNVKDSKSNLVFNMMSFLNLTQYNNIRNCNKVLLDLVFTNYGKCLVEQDTCPIVPEDRHHPALNINLVLKTGTYENLSMCTDVKTYNFKKADYVSLYNGLLTTNWDVLYESTNVNSACETLYRILYSLFDKHVPLFKCSKFSFPSWYTTELRQQIILKHKVFREIKRKPSCHLRK